MADYTAAYIERIARAYCARLGINPDERVFSSNGAEIPGGDLMWRIKSRDVRQHLAMRDALAEIADQDSLGDDR